MTVSPESSLRLEARRNPNNNGKSDSSWIGQRVPKGVNTCTQDLKFAKF